MFQGVSTVFQMVSGRFRGVARSIIGIQAGFRRLLKISCASRGSQERFSGLRGFQGVPEAFYGVSEGFRES